MNASRTGDRQDVLVRTAHESDLETIVRMLRDDSLGAQRERGDDDIGPYRDAFREIAAERNHELLVLELDGAVVGVLQLSFLRCLTHQGGLRAQIEGVRVDARRRGSGLGRLLIADAVRRARARGCHLVQLTTDRQRPEALAFYEHLGFVDSHHGMKLQLGNA